MFETLPFIVKTSLIVWTFLVSLIVFHLVFVVLWNPGKRAWIVVEYMWLGTTAIGLFGVTYTARQSLASVMFKNMKANMASWVDPVQDEFRSIHMENVCTKFTWDAGSPPKAQFDATQRDFDANCAWFKELRERIKPTVPWQHIDAKSLPPAPTVKAALPKEDQIDLWKSLADHNRTADRLQALSDATQRSESEIS